MDSNNLPYLPRLDHVRFLATALVFLFHFSHYYYFHWQPQIDYPWLGLVTEGHTGVGLFFTLSGFLFMLIALHNPVIDYKRFIRNRFLRIFPMFLIVFFVAISIGRDIFSPADILYLFFSNIGKAPTSIHFITGAAWSISLEFTFYLIFPFLGRFAHEQGPQYLLKLLLLLLLFKLGAYGVTERSTHMLYSTLVGRFDQFIIGMLAAMLYSRHKEVLKKYGVLLLPLAMVVVVINSALQARYASFFLVQPKQVFWIFWSMLEACGWALFITAWVSSMFTLPKWLDRFMRRGGEISFSFYLMHTLIIYLTYEAFGLLTLTGNVVIDGMLTAVGLYFLTWIAASISYETIEKPFLGLRSGYGKSSKK
jgi:peptidoglycan/LPS O-acetylase OafA/YrhL